METSAKAGVLLFKENCDIICFNKELLISLKN